MKTKLILLLFIFLLLSTVACTPITETAKEIKKELYEPSREGNIEYCQKFPNSTECRLKLFT